MMTFALAEEVIYVHDEAELSNADIARATGAATSTVRSWLAGTRQPARSNQTAERLIELSTIVQRLIRIMEPSYVSIWLRRPIPALDDRKPLDMIRDGDYREVSRIVAALESPPAA